MTARAALILAAALALAALAGGCGVKSDPAWPGGVWGDPPSRPGGASADKPAPAATP